MKQQFLKGKTGTIRLTIFEKNYAQIPSAALITLYTPDGGTLQAQISASVNATTGEMTYSLTATHTADHDLNYKAEWAYTVGGTIYYETQLFDVVKNILSIPITDDDLYSELESLRDVNKQLTGTATAGAAGSLTDTAKLKQEDDYWKGGTIKIISGTGANQERIISGNTQSTGVITISPNWVTNPDTTSVYRIVKSYYPKIERSFKKIEQMLYDKGKRHELILESSQIEIPLIYLTIHFIALDLTISVDDKWSVISKAYWDRFNDSFNSLKLEYDEDGSGTIIGDEQQTGPGSIRIFRS